VAKPEGRVDECYAFNSWLRPFLFGESLILHMHPGKSAAAAQFSNAQALYAQRGFTRNRPGKTPDVAPQRHFARPRHEGVGRERRSALH
jgi:hypothetical protein